MGAARTWKYPVLLPKAHTVEPHTEYARTKYVAWGTFSSISQVALPWWGGRPLAMTMEHWWSFCEGAQPRSSVCV